MNDVISLPRLMRGYRDPSNHQFEGGEQAIVMTRRRANLGRR